jgi:15-cis-phytoene synthase
MLRGGRELHAAGITSPRLRAGYELCRRINARHGKTYYLATLLLPAAKRPYVHALYGFARYADDIVDAVDADAERFEAWSAEFVADIELGTSTDPVCRAVIDTIGRWDIPRSHFSDFLDAMRADLTVTSYDTYDDLATYMWGSAAVIGLQMLPILGRADPSTDWVELQPYAVDLGIAFQYTNFLRDVGEDLKLGRVYLPQDSLRAFGVDRDRLRRAAHRREVDEPIRNLLATEIARARDLYRHAAPGVELVDPTSRDCLRTAFVLYSRILDEIEAADYNVFGARLSVPVIRRAGVAARGLVGAVSARRARPAVPM